MALPVIDHWSCVFDAGEPALVQAILAHLAVEALDERVLRRLAWPDPSEGSDPVHVAEGFHERAATM